MDDIIIFGLTATDIAGRALMLACAVFVAAVVSHLLSTLLRRVLDASNVPSASIFVNLARALVWAFALLSVIQPVFGVQPTAFVTALGVTSLAISLGMQDTISNIVGGLGLMVGKVVQPGDFIEVSGFQGEVTDVNWRSTTVRDRLGNEQVIPNSVLTASSLKQLSHVSATLVEVTIVVSHDADLNAVSDEIVAAAEEVLAEWNVPDCPTGVFYSGSDVYGVQCAIDLHVNYGISQLAAKNRLMRAISGRPWFAREA